MRRAHFAVVVLFVLSFASIARADAKARSDAYEAKNVAALQAVNPAAVPDFEAGSKALELRDLKAALDAYDRVLATTPRFTPAIRRRAVVLAYLGKHDEAVETARSAMQIDDAPENRLALARVLVMPPPNGHVAKQEANEALKLIRDRATQEPDDADVQLTYCQVAIGAQSLEDLPKCAGRAMNAAPDEPEPYVFGALAALSKGDRDGAREYAAKAKSLGADPKALEFLDKVQDETEPWLWKWAKRFFYIVCGWGVITLLFSVIGNAFSKRTLALAEELAETRGETQTSATLRRWYRALLFAASAFYYVSLPFALVLSVIAGLVVLYGILYTGYIPLGIIVIVLTLVAYTLKSVIQGFIVRGKDENPGLLVNLEKHTGLANLLREVADRVGTRPVDRVYLTPKADVAVYERGGLMAEWRGTTERVLLLGVGVLDGMKVQPFKAILAHEYGHFSNRDTAGGRLALFVRRSILLTAMNMGKSGAATIYNPAWLFMRTFGNMFLRISQGASRLQEVMADRVAASAYGPEAFAAGLHHVVRREFEVSAHIESSLKELIASKQPLANLYRFEPKKKPEDVTEKIENALSADPSPFDSHPKPTDRLRWIRAQKSSLPPTASDADDAWTLFTDRETIEARVTDEVRHTLAQRGIMLAEPPDTAA